jgi:hypothetical protein
MISSDKFKTFDDYENYLNKITRLWSLTYKIFPELKNIKENTVFTYAYMNIVNSEKLLDKEIQVLEMLNSTTMNIDKLKERYIKAITREKRMVEDFI